MAEAKETTIIGADTRIKGEMSFEQAALIQGRFEGSISAKGELRVAETATCAAEVIVGSVVVDGRVEGNVRATSMVRLNQKATLKGDIVAERLVTAEGASIFGHVAVGPEATRKEPGRPGSQPNDPTPNLQKNPKPRQEGA